MSGILQLFLQNVTLRTPYLKLYDDVFSQSEEN